MAFTQYMLAQEWIHEEVASLAVFLGQKTTATGITWSVFLAIQMCLQALAMLCVALHVCLHSRVDQKS
jgi:hypothetical protein